MAAKQLSLNEKRVAAAALAFTAIVAVAVWNPIHQKSQSQQAVFRNDTAHDARLRLCTDETCTRFELTDAWTPGSAVREAVSDHGVLTRWLVADARTGAALGCLPIQLEHRYERVVVRASQMVPCPGALVQPELGQRLGV